MTGTLSNITRVESWSYFEPRIDILALSADPIGEPDYTFIGDRAELGVKVEGGRFDLSGAFNYVRLENLPTRAIGPGGFGSGAFYFAATGVSYSYQLYFGELTLRVKSRDRRQSITIGRMAFEPAGPRRLALARERLDSRLLGNFEWSLYQRRYDGVRVDVDRGGWHVMAGAFLPTQGGFEESTNLTMPKIQVATASATRTGGAPEGAPYERGSETQVFVHLYRDRRDALFAVVDNTLARDQPVDVTVAAFGGSHARVTPVRSGEVDVVAWGAAQAGDWYGRSHRAASLAVEGGHRWTRPAWRPWLRAGLLWASGDADREDATHGTFFQMLPTSRKYALSAVYAQMNLRDAFVQARVEPRGLRARIEVHALALASGQDLWYAGSGATASRDRYFGFAGRHADGETALGTVVESAVDVPIRKYWSVNAYAGTMRGGAVVRRQFTGKPLFFWYVENVVRF